MPRHPDLTWRSKPPVPAIALEILVSPFSHFFAPFYFNDFEGLESLKGHDQEEALNARLKEVGKLFEELNQVDWDAAAEALMTDLQRAW